MQQYSCMSTDSVLYTIVSLMHDSWSRLRIYRNMVLKLSKYLYGIWAARSLSMGNIWEYGSTNFLQNGIQLHVLTVVNPLSAQIRRKPVKSRFLLSDFERY